MKTRGKASFAGGAFSNGLFDLTFEKPITILVDENGSGKSTLLEAIATMAGFGEGGGAQGTTKASSMSSRNDCAKGDCSFSTNRTPGSSIS
ncbi:AAA family ATPase [Sphingomonas sp. Leaf22]|uniref:AAA family ATPase n=1 Tax=Sphingomonas sp. Leaf22 TaxID=1735687 RepID=UPI00191027AA|nr:AAA family ATPase [Sphingomonas sp. Leaf22]